ncbi:MAG TPA: rhodanese-like domain-containing protein [Candidatus Binatia bacterium]|nr:rhodanese-like domain-containing protein [Candidatus Binatia bacterium]
MNIPQVTPNEAHETLQRNPGAVYLDVRTEEEFEAGHPVGARNVPVVRFDPATRQPRPNPDFVAIVGRSLPPTTKLVIGCQSGGRSQHACELLAQAGWTDVANVRGGFGGARDQSGRTVAGWRDAGLPVATGRDPG